MDLCQQMMASLSSSAVPLSGLTYCILIKGHGRAGNIRRVRQTYASMRELQVAIDLPTFNALTDAFVRNGRLGQAGSLTLALALTLTLAAIRRRPRPNPSPGPSMNPSPNRRRPNSNPNPNPNQAEAVLEQMAAVGVEPSTRTFNTLLKGYSRAGQLGRAFSVVRPPLTRYPYPDPYPYPDLLPHPN